MRFFVRKRRQTPTVIIVALIDVLIVLLIFLMVTTTFKQQAALKLALPESTQAQKTGANENPPLVISVDTNGVYYLGEDKLPLTFVQLQTELKSSAVKNPHLKVAIRGDEGAPWGKIVKVMDAAREAKIEMVDAYAKEAPKQ